MTVEPPTVSVESELWKLISKYMQQRPTQKRPIQQRPWGVCLTHERTSELHQPSRPLPTPGKAKQVTLGQATSASLTSALPLHVQLTQFFLLQRMTGNDAFLQHKTPSTSKHPSLTIPNTELSPKWQALLSSAGWDTLVPWSQVVPSQSGIYQYFLSFSSLLRFCGGKRVKFKRTLNEMSNKGLHCPQEQTGTEYFKKCQGRWAW